MKVGFDTRFWGRRRKGHFLQSTQYQQGLGRENIRPVQRTWNSPSNAEKDGERERLVVLESPGCRSKELSLSFISNVEPMKGTDQQRNDHGCCALNWRNEEDQQEKGKI